MNGNEYTRYDAALGKPAPERGHTPPSSETEVERFASAFEEYGEAVEAQGLERKAMLCIALTQLIYHGTDANTHLMDANTERIATHLMMIREPDLRDIYRTISGREYGSPEPLPRPRPSAGRTITA